MKKINKVQSKVKFNKVSLKYFIYIENINISIKK